VKPSIPLLPAAVVLLALAQSASPADNPNAGLQIGDAALRLTIDKANGLPTDVESPVRHWLAAPATMTVKRESTGATASPSDGAAVGENSVTASLATLGLTMSSRWVQDRGWLVGTMDFSGASPRGGHEVILELPILNPSYHIFTPSDRGVMDLAMHPTFTPVSYGAIPWDGSNSTNGANGEAYVLPLVSVFDPSNDAALTIALPPDDNIPHLQVQWKDAHTLRLTFGHRGMGGGKPSPLKILFATHAADYRSALAAYAARYPAYFETPMPRSDNEGAFWYHHIQDHPDFTEMQRQNVRFIWSSFWFNHLGDYLPQEKEWFPYTYAKWWNLGKKMDDKQINAFIDEMRGRGIATYAYFNVTEYGGSGGQSGGTAEAQRILEERFANALMKDANGKAIPTWEGAMAMNARSQYALRPFLQEQIRRHVDRLPNFDGFIIDRLDWGSQLDYGHDDGLTMVGDRPVDNMAGAVAEAVQDVCRMTHEAKKRVFVNQFYRVELLRDVDGSCHECDYLAQGYLEPFRPAAAWLQQRPYLRLRDLAPFEAHLKRRLLIALQPQMIAHKFPISQQSPDESAADLMELFSPLFKVFTGKRQVLEPHCVAVTGANDVSLFTDSQGHYLVPLTSRTRFLTRGDRGQEAAEVTIALADAPQLKWARAIPLGDKPYDAAIEARDGKAVVKVSHHGAATMLVLGKGNSPAVDDTDAARLITVRDARFPRREITPSEPASAPTAAVADAALSLDGTCFYHPGPFTVKLGETTVGTLNGSSGSFTCTIDDLAKPVVRVIAGDDGVWYLPERVRLTVHGAEKSTSYATWSLAEPIDAASSPKELVLPLRWTRQSPETAEFKRHDTDRGGNWIGAYGATAAWLAGTPSATSAVQNGFRFDLRQGAAFAWAARSDDARALMIPDAKDKKRIAACWFDTKELACQITPPDDRPYRLTAYLLDYDRAGRSVDAAITDSFGERLDARPITAKQMDGGVYLTWTVRGTAKIELRYTGSNPQANATLSAAFIDP
jgi:hypothetical protein